jgi:transcriptional regulator with XRE-family HTH domain
MVQPEDIIQIRKAYDLTQKELASLLGWGEVTLSRYENGALQDLAHDKMLHLAKQPENLLALIEQFPGSLSGIKRYSIVSKLLGYPQGYESIQKQIYRPLSSVTDNYEKRYIPEPSRVNSLGYTEVALAA